MKIHPVVGAEILERVQFPDPVVPIVRSHHEKWDGSGYPHGLKGEEIPIGARILAAVDCLDALASDRQYRKALPLAKAMDIVRAESGRAFGPKIVEILERRRVGLEQRAVSHHQNSARLSTAVKVSRGMLRPADLRTRRQISTCPATAMRCPQSPQPARKCRCFSNSHRTLAALSA